MIACEIEKCVGCRMCEVACCSRHFGAVSPALARIRVAKLEEIGIDLAVACVSCFEKLCLACPNDALSAGDDGTIIVNAGSCGGCRECVSACPVGAVGFHDGVPLFCDLCGGEPACVKACPSMALSHRDEYRGTSLNRFLDSRGNPGQKRAAYARIAAEPLRDAWKSGARVRR